MQRLLYCLVNEGFRLLGEGGLACNRVGDIDVVYVIRWGSARITSLDFPLRPGGGYGLLDYCVISLRCLCVLLSESLSRLITFNLHLTYTHYKHNIHTYIHKHTYNHLYLQIGTSTDTGFPHFEEDPCFTCSSRCLVG